MKAERKYKSKLVCLKILNKNPIFRRANERIKFNAQFNCKLKQTKLNTLFFKLWIKNFFNGLKNSPRRLKRLKNPESVSRIQRNVLKYP